MLPPGEYKRKSIPPLARLRWFLFFRRVPGVRISTTRYLTLRSAAGASVTATRRAVCLTDMVSRSPGLR